MKIKDCCVFISEDVSTENSYGQSITIENGETSYIKSCCPDFRFEFTPNLNEAFFIF